MVASIVSPSRKMHSTCSTCVLLVRPPCLSVSNIFVILDGGRRWCCPLAGMGPLPTSTLDGLYPLHHACPNIQSVNLNVPGTLRVILIFFVSGLGVVNVFCAYALNVHQLPDLPSGSLVCKSNLPRSFSLATNVTCTILIGYRAWWAYQTQQKKKVS